MSTEFNYKKVAIEHEKVSVPLVCLIENILLMKWQQFNKLFTNLFLKNDYAIIYSIIMVADVNL